LKPRDNHMDPLDSYGNELRAVAHRLKLYLGSLRMMGVRDWPRQIKASSAQTLTDDAGAMQGLAAVEAELGDCRRCRLHTGRTHIVFGEGSHRARLVFVGEGPGFDEDQQGRPFVGRAGKLLNKMIQAIGLRREEVYICNVVKCRPPNNRTPNQDEVATCTPFLWQQLETIQPRVICALGASASQALLSSSAAISALRGKSQFWRGMRVVCTFHPAYLLRNPSQKAGTWQDLIEIQRILHCQQETPK
jgi:uracil-DNA glycosylase